MSEIYPGLRVYHRGRARTGRVTAIGISPVGNEPSAAIHWDDQHHVDDAPDDKCVWYLYLCQIIDDDDEIPL